MNKPELTQLRKLNPREVKAAFALRGTSMRKWAEQEGFAVSSVSMALHGNRAGRRSAEIVEKLDGLVTK